MLKLAPKQPREHNLQWVGRTAIRPRACPPKTPTRPRRTIRSFFKEAAATGVGPDSVGSRAPLSQPVSCNEGVGDDRLCETPDGRETLPECKDHEDDRASGDVSLAELEVEKNSDDVVR